MADVVARILQRFDLGDSLVVAPDPTLEGIPWSNRLSVERRAAAGGDRLSVTGAYAAVAETGRLVLLSSPESPTTLNFLPEDHVTVVRESQIVSHIEDVWVRMRQRQTRHAAHRQLHHRTVEDRRRGANHPGRRPRPAKVARDFAGRLKGLGLPYTHN